MVIGMTDVADTTKPINLELFALFAMAISRWLPNLHWDRLCRPLERLVIGISFIFAL